MPRLVVQVENGKYTVIQTNKGSVIVNRFDEVWRDATGDNLILALAQEIDRLREGLKTLKVAVNDKQPDPGATNFIEKLLPESSKPKNTHAPYAQHSADECDDPACSHY